MFGGFRIVTNNNKNGRLWVKNDEITLASPDMVTKQIFYLKYSPI